MIRSSPPGAIRAATGLGLHTAYSIVTDRLGGHLDLKSEPGRGTRVGLKIPKVAPRAFIPE